MLKYSYDISVVIPVYNLENHIEKCVNSIIEQKYPFSKIEVVLVNDGSEDNSRQYCEKFSQKYKNIKLINQENAGVSAARNAGIKNASGKYIMFLDGDDSISKHTVGSLVTFFDEHYDDVDLVTYNLIYLNENGSKSSHERYKILSHEGVFDIDENIHIVQTTMNICVKNVENAVLFDPSLHMAEDQFYITDWIMKKHKIGFAENADYLYYRHSAAASSVGNHPYMIFDQMIYFFDGLCEKYKGEHGKPSRVAQSLILYNLNWRLKSDLIYPYHLQGEEMTAAKEKIASYVKMMDDDVILSSPYVDRFHKLYFLKLKQLPCEICFAPQRYVIYSHDVLWVDEFNCELVFTKTNIKNSKLILEGFLKTPASEFYDVNLYVHKNMDRKGVKLQTVRSFYSAYKSPVMTNNFRHFHYEADLCDTEMISFSVSILGHRYRTRFYFAGNSLLLQGKSSFVSDDYLIKVHCRYYGAVLACFSVQKLEGSQLAHAKRVVAHEHYNRSKGGALYRRLIKKKNQKPIWIYTDRHGVVDNAFYQFKNDFNKNDGIDRYYVLDNDADKLSLFTRKEKKFLLKFGSLKHKLLFLNSSKILSSFNSLSIYSPFPTVQLLAYYGDLTHFELIYLQHGILHANLVNLYSKERSTIDKLVVSSHFEVENMIKNYGYTKDDLIPSGMPRYDCEKRGNTAQRKILFSPSWRRNLIGALVNKRRELKPDIFLNSAFYNQINEFLNSPRLAQILLENDLTLDFKNHPIFEDYNEYFTSSDDRVNVISGNIEMDKYKLMITDYSSIVFDFVYLERPILYFVPDYDMFRSGLTHTYHELDLPFKEGFGAFTQTSDELLDELEKLVKNDFKPAEIYQKRMDDFFITKENHCEKLYNYLINDTTAQSLQF